MLHQTHGLDAFLGAVGRADVVQRWCQTVPLDGLVEDGKRRQRRRRDATVAVAHTVAVAEASH